MTNKKCSNNCSCSHVDGKHTGEKKTPSYGFYSNVLKKPFERLDDLEKAEYVYFEEQKLKENKAATKKADANKVEDAFKALNAARKVYKEDLAQLTKEYSETLADLQKAFDIGSKDIKAKLAAAEEAYSTALKEFSDKYPEGYRIHLKDGDFETTISGSSSVTDNDFDYADFIKLLFGF